MKFLIMLSLCFSTHLFADERLGCDSTARELAKQTLEHEGFKLTGQMNTVVVDSKWGNTKYTSMQTAYIYSHPDNRQAYATCHGLLRHPVKTALYSVKTYSKFSHNGHGFVRAIPTLDSFETYLVQFDIFFDKATRAYLGGYRDQVTKPATELQINSAGYISRLDFIQLKLSNSGEAVSIKSDQTLQISSKPQCTDFEPIKLPFIELSFVGSSEFSYNGISIEYALNKCKLDAVNSLESNIAVGVNSCSEGHGVIGLGQDHSYWREDSDIKTFFCSVEQLVYCQQPNLTDRILDLCHFADLSKAPSITYDPIHIINTAANAGIQLSVGTKICVDHYPSPIKLINNSEFIVRYKLADSQGSLQTKGDAVTLAFIVPSTLILSPYDGSELRTELSYCK